VQVGNALIVTTNPSFAEVKVGKVTVIPVVVAFTKIIVFNGHDNVVLVTKIVEFVPYVTLLFVAIVPEFETLPVNVDVPDTLNVVALAVANVDV
jgi:hypothetical protein